MRASRKNTPDAWTHVCGVHSKPAREAERECSVLCCVLRNKSNEGKGRDYVFSSVLLPWLPLTVFLPGFTASSFHLMTKEAFYGYKSAASCICCKLWGDILVLIFTEGAVWSWGKLEGLVCRYPVWRVTSFREPVAATQKNKEDARNDTEMSHCVTQTVVFMGSACGLKSQFFIWKTMSYLVLCHNNQTMLWCCVSQRSKFPSFLNVYGYDNWYYGVLWYLFRSWWNQNIHLFQYTGLF